VHPSLRKSKILVILYRHTVHQGPRPTPLPTHVNLILNTQRRTERTRLWVSKIRSYAQLSAQNKHQLRTRRIRTLHPPQAPLLALPRCRDDELLHIFHLLYAVSRTEDFLLHPRETLAHRRTRVGLRRVRRLDVRCGHVWRKSTCDSEPFGVEREHWGRAARGCGLG
jgi:hypothetical protein